MCTHGVHRESGDRQRTTAAATRCTAKPWSVRSIGMPPPGCAAAQRPAPPVGRLPRTGPAPLAGLTPQQQRIARYVAEGATNREVAVRLSVSPRPVDHHLRNVFATLGVRSRTELARVLGHP